jgi:ribosomal protein L37E
VTTPTPPFTCPRCGRTSHHPKDAETGYCGNCHAFTRAQLRMRLYVAGKVVDEQWVDSPELVEQIGARHQAIAEDAERAGQVWMVEVWDPDAPENAAYLRFGTDQAGMVEPSQVKTWPWMQ